MPAYPASLRLDGDQRRAVSIIQLGALAGPEVRRGVAGGQVDQAQVGVVGHCRPDVGSAQGIGLPGWRATGRLRIAGVPGPDQVTAAHIEGANHARRLAHMKVVRHTAADDHQLTCYQGCGGLLIVAILHLAHVHLQVHRAVIAEVVTELAGLGVDSQQASIAGGQEQAALATGCGQLTRQSIGACLCSFLGEIAEAAAALPHRRMPFRVEHPALLARVHIQREYLTVGIAVVEGVANLQWSVLVFGAGAGALGQLTGTERPGHFELIDIRRGYLVQRGKAIAMGGIAPVHPVALGIVFR